MARIKDRALPTRKSRAAFFASPISTMARLTALFVTRQPCGAKWDKPCSRSISCDEPEEARNRTPRRADIDALRSAQMRGRALTLWSHRLRLRFVADQ